MLDRFAYSIPIASGDKLKIIIIFALVTKISSNILLNFDALRFHTEQAKELPKHNGGLRQHARNIISSTAISKKWLSSTGVAKLLNIINFSSPAAACSLAA